MTPLRPVRTTLVLLAALATSAFAWALDLPTALGHAPELADAVSARLELADEERALERTEADPLALRLDRLQARQAAELARARADVVRYEGYLEIAETYLQVRRAASQRGLAEDGVALAERGRAIARIRLERGAGTELDVRDAENELADARSGLAAARQGEALARRSFESLTGLRSNELEPIPRALLETEVPDEAVLRERVVRAPALLQATQGLEAARVGRDLLDPSYAPAAQIDAAELALAQADEAVREGRRGIDLLLRGLVDQVASARDGLEVAREAYANARERDEVDRSRLDAGLIAEIAYQQTRLATANSAAAAEQAEHDLLLAMLRLQAEGGVPIEGLDAF